MTLFSKTGRGLRSAGRISTRTNNKSSFARRVTALALAAVFALSLTACANSGGQTAQSGTGTADAAKPAEVATAATGETTAAEGGEFVFGIASEVYNFDPFESTTADSRAICFNIYDGLMKITPEGAFEPGLAQEYTMSDDATVYTFTLRDGVKFHNGKTMEMADVLFSIQKAIDAKIKGYDKIASFEATDDKTVQITLAAPDTGFLAYMTQAIVPDGSEDLASNPVGAGPFKFEEFEEQDHVTLAKFEDYWGEKPHLDKVTVRFVANSSEMMIAFQAGTINGFDASAGVSAQVDDTNARLYARNSNAVQLLALNNDSEYFKDEKVRQALSYAVDRDNIIETVNFGYGVKIGTGLIPGLAKYYDSSMDDYYTTDAAKAKELLKEAGYEDGFEFTVTVPSNYQVHIDTAQVLVNQLAAIGVTMNIKEVDWATWLESVYTNRNYEATIISLDGSFAYPTAFLARYESTSSSNFVNFKSDDFDKAYNAATTSTNDEEQVKLFKECQQILTKEAASVYLEDISSIYVYSMDFDGFVSYPLYAYDFSAIYKVAE